MFGCNVGSGDEANVVDTNMEYLRQRYYALICPDTVAV